jgi:hypothetical protein
MSAMRTNTEDHDGFAIDAHALTPAPQTGRDRQRQQDKDDGKDALSHLTSSFSAS